MIEMTARVLDRRTFVRAALATGGAVLSGFLLSGCAQQEEPAQAPAQESQASQDAPKASSSSLVMYFTCPEPTGSDTVAGASRVVVDGALYGNIEYISTLIADRMGSDVFVIETVQEYPADHDELIDFSVAEMDAGTLPELQTSVVDLSNYDTVFLGYPIWNAQLPMPVCTVLNEADFTDKAIVCFTVHGGSAFGGTLRQIRAAEPGANVVEGFSVSRNSVGAAAPDVDSWLSELGY